MDLLALKKAMKYTDKAIQDIVFVDDSSDLFDRQISVGLLLNYIRQNEDSWTEKGFTLRTGTVNLSNSLAFPFNDSKATVPVSPSMPDTTYAIIARIDSSAGNAGEIEVSDKLINGFKLAYTGSAKSAVVEYIAIGGFSE